jgi:hypothetical protein
MFRGLGTLSPASQAIKGVSHGWAEFKKLI